MTSVRARVYGILVGATALVLALAWIAAASMVSSAEWASAARILAAVSAVALAAITAAAELVSRHFLAPLEELRAVAEALTTGDLTARVRTQRRVELGALGRAIDRMADQLRARIADVHADEARLRVMLDAMDEAVIVTRPDGDISLTNAAFVRLTGQAAIGRTSIEVLRSGELHDAFASALRGKAVSVTFHLAAQGAQRTMSARVAPLPEGAGAIAVMHDVTERHRAEAVRRDFVANASHELRTPLTAIRGFAETLRDGALARPDVARRFVESIGDNAVRLSRIVDDLLELSRAESPDARFDLVPVDARDAARKVLEALEGKALAKRIELALEDGDAVLAVADADALDQILINLVDNAIKYTPSDGRVRVRVTRDETRAVIEVRDTGPGIPAHHLPRIFERFYRVDAGRSRQQGGTGLGLSIVRHLATRIHAEVRVESQLGHGSTFRVSMPLRAASVRAPTDVPRS